MNSCNSSFFRRHFYPILPALLLMSGTSNAQTNDFKVVYANVPGIQEIRDRNYRAAIKILESRAADVDTHYVADERATLCALYIVTRRLSAASVTCHKAVEVDGSDAAYNNRGVFRAHLGNAAGALEDFRRARVRPGKLQSYITERMQRDARFVASSNYAVATTSNDRRHISFGQSLASRVRGASVEDITN